MSAITRKPTNDDVVPDSEEERVRIRRADHGASAPHEEDIICLSSDEEPLLIIPKPFPKSPSSYKPGPHHLITRLAAPFTDEVIEISDSETESDWGASTSLAVPTRRAQRRVIDSESSDEEPGVDDSILVLDEGVRPGKPFPLSSSKPTPKAKQTKVSNPSKAKKSITRQAPAKMTKKAAAQAQQERLETYAQDLFEELNEAVFNGGLQKTTQLIWNKRLQTTAGKAKWHRDREGVETCSIDLSTKVLDCEERIRNTLSHEMCHLACWIIDRDPKENHGAKWKRWADAVQKKRKDIVVSTRHDYEISFKFQWKCSHCEKVYGRHSKSIKPSTCVCGVCKKGQLVPLFETRTPKGKANSKMVSNSPRCTPMKQGTDEKGNVPAPSVGAGDLIKHFSMLDLTQE